MNQRPIAMFLRKTRVSVVPPFRARSAGHWFEFNLRECGSDHRHVIRSDIRHTYMQAVMEP